MAKTHNLAIPIAEYQIAGQTQTKWETIGAMFTSKEGKMSMRLNCIPTHHIALDGTEEAWNGWIKIFPVDREDIYDDDFTDPRAETKPLDDGFDDTPF